jgi:hypothetical protein
MREFCNVRTEIKDTAFAQQVQADRYFYENRTAIDQNRYDAALGFKHNELVNFQNTARIEQRIDQMERTFKDDELRRQGNEITTLKSILGVRGLGAVPSYPACPPPCDPCHNNGYGYAYSGGC